MKKNEFYKLKNGQWLKISFYKNKRMNIWFQTIIVGDSKRKCNDCLRKTNKSPKVFFGEISGKNAGLEPLLIALRSLLRFEKTLINTQINIVGASDRLNSVYTYLSRYEYKIHEYTVDNKKRTVVYKEI